jgi:hypothetical protein
MTEAAIAESTASLKLGGQEGAQDFITLSKTDAGLTLSAKEVRCIVRVACVDGACGAGADCRAWRRVRWGGVCASGRQAL